ncbi:enoyl-CoA hydratase/isomerase family protein [Amycolatopsis sp. NPDC051061]|uniref:enoyl-CoA hydratase/isomerase family protein n=1 Tax=Amycolatopsis sp. NPDC051061 TaxID=3155042 RepID=UPI0034258956
MDGPRRALSCAELAGAARAPLLDDRGRIVDPLLVVDLDTPVADGPVRSDRVLVGITTADRLDAGHRNLAAALDLTFGPATLAGSGRMFAATDDPETTATGLCEAAEANPQATLVLAQVLRTAGNLSGPAALDAESLAYSTLLGGAEFKAWLARRGPRALPPAAADPVLVARTGNVLHLTLNRPERRNAFGRQLRDALVDALRIAELDDTVERILLDGAGPSFCAGGDLAEFGTAPDLATAHFVRTRAGAALPLHRLAGRVEARVHGSCVGAGIELPAFAGRVIAHPAATFRLPEIGMGLLPGAGGTVSIPRRIGRWRTLLLALTGEPLDAATALAWGLVDELDPQAGVQVKTGYQTPNGSAL